MNRFLASLGLILTAAYLISVGVFLSPRIQEINSLAPNELGDTLAGIFGPLAILWLILGFFQQGVELRQNTEALRLQAEELRNSVEQQRQLVEVTREQVKAEMTALQDERMRRLEAARPRFVFHGVGASFGQESEYQSRLKNLGNTATEVRFTFEPPLKRCSHTVVFSWSRGEEQHMRWVYATGGQPEGETQLVIDYVDADGLSGSQRFRFIPEPGSTHTMVKIEHVRA